MRCTGYEMANNTILYDVCILLTTSDLIGPVQTVHLSITLVAGRDTLVLGLTAVLIRPTGGARRGSG